jgi:hypothetical protein
MVRYILAGWKGFLPAIEACTSLTGRETLHSESYMYLAGWKGFLPSVVDWKGFLPAGKVHSPTVGRTSPAGRKPFQPAISSGYPLGCPDIRQVWGG